MNTLANRWQKDCKTRYDLLWISKQANSEVIETRDESYIEFIDGSILSVHWIGTITAWIKLGVRQDEQFI